DPTNQWSGSSRGAIAWELGDLHTRQSTHHIRSRPQNCPYQDVRSSSQPSRHDVVGPYQRRIGVRIAHRSLISRTASREPPVPSLGKKCVGRRVMRVRTFLTVILALMIAIGAAAQTTTGTISGRVLDTQGAALPGATVVAKSPNLQGSREAVTSENGDY